MDQDVKPAFLLPPSAEVKAAEAAAAGLRLTAIEFFPVVVILGMMVGAAAWLRPSVEAQTHQKHSLLYRVATWPARRLIHAVGVIEHRIMHAMSKWLAPKVGTVAHAFNSLTHEIGMLATVVADTADNTHEALTFLRHKVIPDLISDALKPIRTRLKAVETKIETAFDTVTETVKRLQTVVIPALEARIETLVKTVTQLQEVVIPELERGIATLTTFITETLPAQLAELRADVDGIRDRITKLEDYIMGAAFLALIVAAVEKSLSFLTCRNMKKFGNEACAAEEIVMDTLTVLAFGALTLASLEQLTRLALSVENEVVGIAKDQLSA